MSNDQEINSTANKGKFQGMVWDFIGNFQFPTIAQVILISIVNLTLPFLLSVVKKSLGYGRNTTLLKKEWKPNVVYLFQFPRLPQCPNASPFCLKVETFLRIHKIPYESVHTLSARSNQGLIPFVELNGRHIADSALILGELKRIHNIKDYDNARDEARGRALSLAVDKHTFAVLLKNRFLDNTPAFIRLYIIMGKFPNWAVPIITPLAQFFIRRKITLRLHSLIGIFPNAVYDDLLNKDLKMIEDSLEEGNNFLFGERITEADLIVFTMLGTIIYLPLSPNLNRLITENYPKLNAYLERIKSETWGDEFEEK